MLTPVMLKQRGRGGAWLLGGGWLFTGLNPV
jgi:hypothetical protein